MNILVKRGLKTVAKISNKQSSHANISNETPRLFYKLLCASVVPYSIMSVAGIASPEFEHIWLSAMSIYGCTGLTFSGAVYCGAVIKSTQPKSALLFASFLPGAIGVLSLAIPYAPWTLSLQALAAVFVYGLDRKATLRNILPKWYLSAKLWILAVSLTMTGLSVSAASIRNGFIPSELELQNLILRKYGVFDQRHSSRNLPES